MPIAAETGPGRLADAQAGSPEAIGAVLSPVRPYLLRIAQGELTPDLAVKSGPSDLVQETFLEAVHDFRRFSGTTDGELRAWLRCLLLRHIARLRRLYRATGKRNVGREVSLPARPASADAACLAGRETSPSSRASADEQLQVLDQVLRRLPEDYRTVIRLRYSEQLSFDEVGAAMGRSTNAVTLLWVRAVKKIRDEIGADL